MTVHPPLTFTVPLSWAAHAQAEELRSQQVNPAQAKRAYLNTLAVHAVDHYLKCLGFNPALNQSDSQDRISPRFLDVADLTLPELGTLECRPVLPDATVMEVPLEAQAERIGYLAVQFNEALTHADILGYAPDASADIPLSQLQPLDHFPDFLYQVQQSNVTATLPPFPLDVVMLGQWVDGILTQGWQSLEALFQDYPQFATLRGQLGAVGQTLLDIEKPAATLPPQVKLFDLGYALGDQTVAMMVTLAPQADQSLQAQIRVYPTNTSNLPPHLQLRMLTETGDILQSVSSRGDDNYIQLKPFSGEKGDRFRLQLVLEDLCLTENFVF